MSYYVPNQWALRTERPAGQFQERGNRAHQAHGQTRTHRTDFEGNGNSSTSSAHAQPAEDPMALLQRLASAGILQLPSTSVTPAPNVPTSRHKQCINCDRRFDVSRQSKEYQEHLDWHFKENRQRKTAKKNFAGRVGLGSREGRGYHG